MEKLAALPGVEVLSAPVINQALVRFNDPEGHHDARTAEVIQKINESGEAWFGGTTWHGMHVMRISVANFRTTRDDIERAITAVRQAMELS